MKAPFSLIKARRVTEKTTMLESLHNAENNPSLAKCKNPKYVFEVAMHATKPEIARAIEQIYSKSEVKVLNVNTIRVKRKPKRQRKGRPGFTASFKKAIVTMEEGDVLESA